MIFLGKLLNSMGWSNMFGAGDDLFGLFSHHYVNNIGLSAFFLDGSTYPMISSVWHTFVY